MLDFGKERPSPLKDRGARQMTSSVSAAHQSEIHQIGMDLDGFPAGGPERSRRSDSCPTVEVSSGAVGVAARGRLRASAIGSCVGVVLCDPVARVSGLAHVMLPGQAPSSRQTEEARYAEGGIQKLLDAMIALGARRRRLVACMAGGGNVLEREDDTLCGANISSVQQTLDSLRIVRVAEDVGGMLRRSLTVDVDSGRVLLTLGDGRYTVLWERPAKDMAREDESDE
jgi:chemotaxis protein CheD